jgi:hypothetical protein
MLTPKFRLFVERSLVIIPTLVEASSTSSNVGLTVLNQNSSPVWFRSLRPCERADENTDSQNPMMAQERLEALSPLLVNGAGPRHKLLKGIAEHAGLWAGSPCVPGADFSTDRRRGQRLRLPQFFTLGLIILPSNRTRQRLDPSAIIVPDTLTDPILRPGAKECAGAFAAVWLCDAGRQQSRRDSDFLRERPLHRKYELLSHQPVKPDWSFRMKLDQRVRMSFSVPRLQQGGENWRRCGSGQACLQQPRPRHLSKAWRYVGHELQVGTQSPSQRRRPSDTKGRCRVGQRVPHHISESLPRHVPQRELVIEKLMMVGSTVLMVNCSRRLKGAGKSSDWTGPASLWW